MNYRKKPQNPASDPSNSLNFTPSSPVYLDYAATSPLLPEVKAAMLNVLEEISDNKLRYGNASALHTSGQRAHHLIETARAHVARLLGADPSEIIFTSGGSESNNTIIHSFADQNIATSAIEHSSILEPARAYAKNLTVLPVDQWGRINPVQIPKTTNLVSVMLASNELGTLEPLQAVAKHCKKATTQTTHEQVSQLRRDADSSRQDQEKYNIFLHTDATQAFGKIPIDVKDLGVDYLTASAHKIGGPQGAGITYCRKGCKLTPLILGGHQENNLRAGTSNLLAIVGLGEAAKWCYDNRSYQKWAKVAKLRDQLRARILAAVPYSSCNSPETNVLPNILNMSFQAAEGESIQLYLDAADIAVSTGSACAAGDLQPSHVLMATRHDAEIAHSSIRFSLGLDTTEDDIDRVMTVLPPIIHRLQGISTVKIS